MEHLPPALGLDALVTEVSERLHAVAAVNDRMRELLEAVVSVSSGLDLHTTLRRIAGAAADLADAEYAAVGVLAPHAPGLVDFIHVGLSDQDAARIGPYPEGRGLLGAIIEDPRPLRLEDLTADPRSVGVPAGHPPMHSFLSVPIRVPDEVFGNLYVTEKHGAAEHQGAPFSGEDQQVMEALAAAAGVAIANARLYEEGRLRERWIAGAGEVTTSMLTSEDAHAALAIAAEQVRDLAAAALGMILLPTGDGGLRVSHAAGEAADFVVGEHVPAGDQVALLMAGQNVIIEDLGGDSRVSSRIAKVFGPGMALPMKSAGRILGAVAVWREVGTPPFTEDEVQLAGAFAGQAALALRLAEGQQDQQRLAVYRDRDRVGRQLIAALREALSNAARHARASTVAVSVDATAHIDDEGRLTSARDGFEPAEGADLPTALREAGAGRPAVLLTVLDDGVGIPEGGRRSGLRNLADRAAALGGTAWHQPGPDGRGTLLCWTAQL